MTLRQRIEENIALWLLGTLLSGFLAGLAAYKTVQEMAGLEPFAKSARGALESKIKELEEAARHASSVQAAEAALANCQDTLKAPKPATDTASRAKPQSTSPSALRAVSVCMRYKDRHSSAALEVRRQLEVAGAKIDLFVRLPDDFQITSGPRTIYYRAEENLPAALAALELTREHGFNRVELSETVGGCLVVPLTW